ncbi:hypothetical protein ACFVGN_12620 [Streptomyces sp. NPDC057757]|uniref:hypothetical protein n=1 Tax=Streptomyces sp. NPDC057757 TaxID=3346241 RepID=UPI0036C79927
MGNLSMAKGWKKFVDEVLDRASDVGRDSRDMTRRILTGKKKSDPAKHLERNSRAIEALSVQLDEYVKHDRAKEAKEQKHDAG